MRARLPDETGSVERGGVKISYEILGTGAPTVLLLPSWSIVHSRLWKAQVPYLARHFRVITFDGRGNGLSDRPKGAHAYLAQEFVADAIAVLDATKTERAIIIGLSLGGHFAGILAARHPERVTSAMLIAPSVPFGPISQDRSQYNFDERLATDEGWAKFNRYYWEKDYRSFAEFFFGEAFSEPHSTKQIEDTVGWTLDTDACTLTDTVLARFLPHEDGEALYRTIRKPVLVVHGDQDRIVPYSKGQAVAKAIGAPLVTLEGAGHLPVARDPVIINRLIRDFVDRTCGGAVQAPTIIRRGLGRKSRVLYLSSPIGLGHARRDLAIATALRDLRPELEIDWLAQHPVTALLECAGEKIHPASRLMVNESGHIESVADGHTLHVFQALRSMDEILVANFMVFQEAIEEGAYDLVIGDEAWEVDHFWHEHPELKRAQFAWLTDFVGYLPMPEGGEHESYLTADYNAEMIEHIARYPHVRDAAIFVGEPDDIVPGTFGPGLPDIRAWTEKHFDFCGYITGRDQPKAAERATLRSRFGYGEDETICIVTVGGSGVGAPLLRRIAEAYPAIHRKLPKLRMIMVTGPRINAGDLQCPGGIEVHGYIPDLNQHLAACDIALVQGGLTTCMELTAAQIPFLYFPLRNHFEQNFHVAHRLNRYGAGRAMDYDTATPDAIADAILGGLSRPILYRAVEQDGAARAAGLIAPLI